MNFLDQRLPDRFWNKVTPEPNSGCWLWFGAGPSSGDGEYGRFMLGRKEGQRLAHRYAYETLIGPTALQLDHLCRTRCCVNPAHLEPVTCKENVRRGISAPALNYRKEACNSGHSFTDENTRITKSGGRYCRACANARTKRGRASMTSEQRVAFDAKHNARKVR